MIPKKPALVAVRPLTRSVAFGGERIEGGLVVVDALHRMDRRKLGPVRLERVRRRGLAVMASGAVASASVTARRVGMVILPDGSPGPCGIMPPQLDPE